jgi:hypothetical protein
MTTGLAKKIAGVLGNTSIHSCADGVRRAKWKALAAEVIDAAGVAELVAENERLRSGCKKAAKKCEQYWNQHGICDEEVHSILEFIHRAVWVDNVNESEVGNDRT